MSVVLIAGETVEKTTGWLVLPVLLCSYRASLFVFTNALVLSIFTEIIGSSRWQWINCSSQPIDMKFMRSAKLVIVTFMAEVIADTIFWLQSRIRWTVTLLVDEKLFTELLADSLWRGLLMMWEIKVDESRLQKTRITLSWCFCRRISEMSAKRVFADRWRISLAMLTQKVRK